MTTRLPRFEGIAERDGGGLAADHGHGAALLRFITVLSMLGGGVDAGSDVAQLNLTRAVRTCIHKRLSKVWEWEIMTIVSAEDTVIS